jgi:hypothetical protein
MNLNIIPVINNENQNNNNNNNLQNLDYNNNYNDFTRKEDIINNMINCNTFNNHNNENPNTNPNTNLNININIIKDIDIKNPLDENFRENEKEKNFINPKQEIDNLNNENSISSC